MSNDQDAVLVRECLKGNRNAFEKLLDRYEKPVYNAAFRILYSYEDAMDVTQTVFLKAFENLDRYNEKFKFFSWIYRIAINESINLLSKRGNCEPVSDDLVSADIGPDAAASNDQLRMDIQDALMSLKPEYRTVVVLKHVVGCSYRDISLILEIPEKTVKSRLFSARQLLRSAVAGEESE
jgi:RNA polymerase sigma-70 factor (ECF subfamily)